MEQEKDPNINPVDELYVGSPIYTPAGQGKRFLNYLLDYICCLSICFIAAFVILSVAVSLGVVNLDAVENIELSRMEDMLLSLLLYFVYYIFFEGIFGTTPGKEMTRTLLITTEGYRPSFKDVLFRSLWRIVPFEAFSFLISKRGLHDERTGTMVVDKKNYVPPFQQHNNLLS